MVQVWSQNPIMVGYLNRESMMITMSDIKNAQKPKIKCSRDFTDMQRVVKMAAFLHQYN